MVKAMREAKVDTGWVEPDERHERRGAAVHRRPLRARRTSWPTSRTCSGGSRRAARPPPSARRCSSSPRPGCPTSTRATSSGASSLVDPDNRRPGRLGAAARGCWTRSLRRRPPRRETAKMFLIHRALDLRARRPEPFAGDYEPLDAGPRRLRLRPRRRGDRRDAPPEGGRGGGGADPRGAARRLAQRPDRRRAELGAAGDGRRPGRRLPVALLERPSADPEAVTGPRLVGGARVGADDRPAGAGRLPRGDGRRPARHRAHLPTSTRRRAPSPTRTSGSARTPSPRP